MTQKYNYEYRKSAWNTANDYNERDPSSWRLQGSNDGTTWTDIHVVRGYFATGTRNARAYEFAGWDYFDEAAAKGGTPKNLR